MSQNLDTVPTQAEETSCPKMGSRVNSNNNAVISDAGDISEMIDTIEQLKYLQKIGIIERTDKCEDINENTLFNISNKGFEGVEFTEEDIPSSFVIFGESKLEIPKKILCEIKETFPELNNSEIYDIYTEILDNIEPDFKELRKRRSRAKINYDAEIQKIECEANELIESEIEDVLTGILLPLFI